jgi:flagellar basal body-associated protein FliL
MFSKAAAPKALLLIPLILLIVAIVLAVLLVMNLTAEETKTPSDNTQQDDNNENQNPTPNPDDNRTPTVKDPKGSDVMHSVPVGYYPDNKCPETLVKESAMNNFAIEGDKKYSLSAANAAWIADNCPDVETLTF